MARVVVVSSHLDDAVFSCWSVIDDPQHDVSVITVFTGAVAGIRGGWDALLDPRIDSIARAQDRQAEDRAALAWAGRAPIHLPFHDGQFGVADPDRIVEALEPILANADLVYAPLAIWNDEHVVVREAVRRVHRRPVLYVDYPYALRRPVEPRKPPAGLLDAYEPRTVELADAGVTKKLDASHEYPGELARLNLAGFGWFVTAENLRRETFFEPLPLD